MRIVQLIALFALLTTYSMNAPAGFKTTVAVVKEVRGGTCESCLEGDHENATALHLGSLLHKTDEIRCDGKAKLLIVASDTHQVLMFNDTQWSSVGVPGSSTPNSQTTPPAGTEAYQRSMETQQLAALGPDRKVEIEEHLAQWTKPEGAESAGSPEMIATGGGGASGAIVEEPSQTVLASRDVKKADRALAKKVRTALSKAKDVSVANITVRAKGGAVTLQGSVPEQPDIDKASQVAQGVAGVTSVKNALTIRPVGQ